MPLEPLFGEGWTTMVYDSKEHFAAGIGYCAACGREPYEVDCKRVSFCPGLDCLREVKDFTVLD